MLVGPSLWKAHAIKGERTQKSIEGFKPLVSHSSLLSKWSPLECTVPLALAQPSSVSPIPLLWQAVVTWMKFNMLQIFCNFGLIKIPQPV